MKRFVFMLLLFPSISWGYYYLPVLLLPNVPLATAQNDYPAEALGMNYHGDGVVMLRGDSRADCLNKMQSGGWGWNSSLWLCGSSEYYGLCKAVAYMGYSSNLPEEYDPDLAIQSLDLDALKDFGSSYPELFSGFDNTFDVDFPANSTGISGDGITGINITVKDANGNVVAGASLVKPIPEGDFSLSDLWGDIMDLGLTPGQDYTIDMSVNNLGGAFMANGSLYLDGTRGNEWTYQGTIDGLTGPGALVVPVPGSEGWTLKPPPISGPYSGVFPGGVALIPGSAYVPQPQEDDYDTPEEYQAALNQFYQQISSIVNNNTTINQTFNADINPEDIQEGVLGALNSGDDAGEITGDIQDLASERAEIAEEATGLLTPFLPSPSLVQDTITLNETDCVTIPMPDPITDWEICSDDIPYRNMMRLIMLWALRVVIYLAMIRELILILRGA